MNDFINSFGIILFATLVYATPLIYAAMGSCFSEVSGVVNIGIEGMMTAGAFAGTVVAYFTGNPWIGFICGGKKRGVVGIIGNPSLFGIQAAVEFKPYKNYVFFSING